MPDVSETQFEAVGLGELVKRYSLKVPLYQRSYAWGTEQARAFCSDISGALSEKAQDYFLGTVVLSRAESTGGLENAFEVVDGQQRLATFILFAAAVRDYLVQDNNEERANVIQESYIAQKDAKSLENRPRLSLNDSDHGFYCDSIINYSQSSYDRAAERPSHNRIIDVYNEVFYHVESFAHAAGANSVAALIDYLEYMSTKVKVIAVKVPSHSNAFVIFETLNDRGIDLAISDLLKNRVFASSEDRLDESRGNWLIMSGAIESVGDESMIVDFIRHHWSSRNGLTREKHLYEQIKTSLTSKTKAVAFSREIASAAKKYVNIVSPGSASSTEMTAESKRVLSAFQVLGAEQVRPLLLSVYEKFSKTEAEKAFRLILSGVVRVIVTSLRGGTYERVYCDLAMSIASKKIVNAKALQSVMVKHFPNNKQFEADFLTLSVSRSNLIKYLLVCIERYANKNQVAWQPSESEYDVNVEHVLPLNRGKEWVHVDVEEHRALKSRLGNLALLSSVDNSQIGNSGFESKRQVFADSSFVTSQWIANYKDWGGKQIEHRQKRLAEIAPKAWPLDVEIRRPKAVKSKLQSTRTAKNSSKKALSK